MHTKTALAIRHIMFEDLDNFGPAFEEHGYGVTYWDAGVDNPRELLATEPDILVVLGGPIGIGDRIDFDFLDVEINLVAKRIERDLPTLGICLGSQVIAAAAGAHVYKGHDNEIGWYPIDGIGDLGSHPIRHLCSGDDPILHWHGDTFDLPNVATHLASSQKYPNQAIQIGNNVLGLQFHPEVSRKGFERWLIANVSKISRLNDVTIPSLRGGSACHGDQLERRGRLFIDEWLSGLS